MIIEYHNKSNLCGAGSCCNHRARSKLQIHENVVHGIQASARGHQARYKDSFSPIIVCRDIIFLTCRSIQAQ
jgi:hypothetical protein